MQNNFGFKVACILFSAVCFYLWLFRSLFLSPPFYAIEYHALDRKTPKICCCCGWHVHNTEHNENGWMNKMKLNGWLRIILTISALGIFFKFKCLNWNSVLVIKRHKMVIERSIWTTHFFRKESREVWGWEKMDWNCDGQWIEMEINSLMNAFCCFFEKIFWKDSKEVRREYSDEHWFFLPKCEIGMRLFKVERQIMIVT